MGTQNHTFYTTYAHATNLYFHDRCYIDILKVPRAFFNNGNFNASTIGDSARDVQRRAEYGTNGIIYFFESPRWSAHRLRKVNRYIIRHLHVTRSPLFKPHFFERSVYSIAIFRTCRRWRQHTKSVLSISLLPWYTKCVASKILTAL